MATPAVPTGAAFNAKIAEMIKAVEGELAAQRGGGSHRWRRIGRGQRLSSNPEDGIYGFPSGADAPVRVGRMVQLAARRTTTSARVLAKNGRLVLRCFDDLGPSIPTAQIRWDSTWLLEELKSVLERRSPSGRLQRLLLEPRAARTELAELSEPLSRATCDLNAEQTQAVRRAAGSDLTLLWGPPGSGKTTTLAALAESWYHEGVTLLVTAWSNRTVDKLLLAIAERLESELTDRRILRVGPIASRDLRERYGRHVTTDGLGPVGNGTDISSLDRAEAVREVLDRYRMAACHPEQRDDPWEGEVENILASDVEQLGVREASDLQAAEIARSDLLDHARIVATTLPRCYLPDQLERHFDGMIVDEASAANVPALVAASHRATKHLVVAGDPRQLPPVVRSQDREVQTWMERDAFAVGGVIPPRPEAKRPSCLVSLPVQYRMHPVIAAMVSELAYGKRLKTASSWTRSSPPPNAFGGQPLVLIDTSRLPEIFARKAVPQSGRAERTNLLHKIVVGRLLNDLFDWGTSSSPPSDGVAVLTPYRAQAARLREAYGHKFPAAFSTVHGAQGEEYSSVLVDLPEANGIRLSPFMRAASLQDKGARMLNVAASRAVDQLIVIANLDYFRPRQRHAPFAWRFFRLLEEHATNVLEADEVLSALPGSSHRASEPNRDGFWKDVSNM